MADLTCKVVDSQGTYSGAQGFDHFREHLEVRAGQFLFIPAGMPHLPFNPSDSEPCVALLARTDPNEQESVVLLD
jgi:uncharacterized RmlC-like cupin family protein